MPCCRACGTACGQLSLFLVSVGRTEHPLSAAPACPPPLAQPSPQGLGAAAQAWPHASPSPLAPLASGLLPRDGDRHMHVVRVRGLKSVLDASQLSAVLTHCFGIPVGVTSEHLQQGHKYISVSRLTFRQMFAEAPVRHYVDPEKGYKIDFESKQASGDPFHMPLHSPDAHVESTRKRPKTSSVKSKSEKRHKANDTPRSPPRTRGLERFFPEHHMGVPPPPPPRSPPPSYYESVPRAQRESKRGETLVSARGMPFPGQSWR